jgi:hypothetical protein
MVSEQGSIRLESFVASVVEIPKVFGNVSLLCSAAKRKIA